MSIHSHQPRWRPPGWLPDEMYNEVSMEGTASFGLGRDGRAYWDILPDDDKALRLEVDLAYWQLQLSGFSQPFASEPTLWVPFSNADHAPDNIAIRGACRNVD